ncbi:YoaK family protein [Brevundimonas sp. M20]|jgi:uncharacterized membrane protein YoaK (UPF0700 family)|uniref:YoaK family protein n=1 Tax=Brevundimonas sp. M20 TaxID=2591463 RepID=UPI001147257C|nr:YoaK family protein [Brevundimonas sp. M20]QDH73612.1 DUF1275 domain-containing protein [Brevundimonas sp. M20]
MKHYGKRGVLLGASLSALAGYVDAIGFMTLGGFFVSFMSGNSTRLGVGLASGDPAQAGMALMLIGLFVAGVVLGGTVARRFGEERRSLVLATETLLLISGAALCGLGRPHVGMVFVVMAMGVENAVFQREGDVGLGLTYMTGTLVRMGQRIATALHGGARWDWLPFLLLWLGLATGGALGALAFLKAGVMALWGAAAVTGLLTVLTAVAERAARRADGRS